LTSAAVLFAGRGHSAIELLKLNPFTVVFMYTIQPSLSCIWGFFGKNYIAGT
jgi:hypothetical protein